jgi:hypothetical protein
MSDESIIGSIPTCRNGGSNRYSPRRMIDTSPAAQAREIRFCFAAADDFGKRLATTDLSNKPLGGANLNSCSVSDCIRDFLLVKLEIRDYHTFN